MASASRTGPVEVLIGAEGSLLSELHSISIPTVQCSFPWNKVHPHSTRLKDMQEAWILAHFAHLSPAEYHRGSHVADGLIKIGVAQLASLAHATAEPSRMEPIVKFFIWVFLLDNLLDDRAEKGADLIGAEALLAGTRAVLDDPDYAYSGEDVLMRLLVEMAKEWWKALQQGMSACQQARFIARLKDFLEANRPQVACRASRSLPDLHTFCLNRLHAVCWMPCAVLIEYGLAIDLDEETFNHPLVQSLLSNAAYYICWVNDLFSFNKELLEGDLQNIIPVLYFHKLQQQVAAQNKSSITMEGIVQEVCAMIKKCDEECVRLMSEIQASQLLMGKPGMARYLEGVGNWLGANFYWHHASGRYGVFSVPRCSTTLTISCNTTISS